jgi:hypothetical protein
MIGLGRPLGLRQVPLRMGWAPAPLALAQAAPTPFKVVVIDVRGNGFRGVQVTLSDGQTTVTDSEGIATFLTPPRGEVDVTLTFDGLTIVRRSNTNQSLFVDLPMCGTPKFVNNTEIIALVVGGVTAGVGTYWKLDALSTVGEIIVGAALFTVIYRHACVW